MARVKLHKRVALIEVSDPLILVELENDPVIQPHLGIKLSPCCIAIKAKNLQEVLRRLQVLGHMPSLCNHQLSTVERSEEA